MKRKLHMYDGRETEHRKNKTPLPIDADDNFRVIGWESRNLNWDRIAVGLGVCNVMECERPRPEFNSIISSDDTAWIVTTARTLSHGF